MQKKAAMEIIAARSQKKQAIYVNAKRVKDKYNKQVLQVGDAGVV